MMRTYENDPVWRKVQEYLPLENRLNENNMPKEEYVDVNKRFHIHVDHYEADSPKAQLLLLHGVGGNGRLLSFLAVPLRKENIEVICPDLPLYGLSEYEGNVSYEDWNDIAYKIAMHYQKEHVPFFVSGLSAGGMLAYETACRLKKVDGLIATCFLDQRNSTVRKETSGKSYPLIPMLKILHQPFGNIKLPMKAVCRMEAIVNDEELCSILESDPLGAGASVSLEFLYGMMYMKLTAEPEQFRKCPVLLAQPEKDQWTNETVSKIFFDRLSCEKNIVRLKDAGHFPIEPEGLKELVHHLKLLTNQ